MSQSILNLKFPSVHKPLKKGLWKKWAPGLKKERVRSSYGTRVK